MLVISGIALSLIAFPLIIVTVVVHFARTKETATYRDIVATPTTPIAHARPGFVELYGRAVPSDQGTVTSPISGREVLSYHLDIKASYHVSQGGNEWRTLRTLRDRREFWLDDGSGKRAFITPHDATAIMPQTRYGGTSALVIGGPPETVVPITPQIEAWAKSCTNEPSRRHSVELREIDIGSTLYVLGSAFDHDGVLVMQNQPGHELFMSTFSEAELVALIHRRMKGRAILAGVTAALTGASVICITLGIVL